jgi:hypothetical protein
MQLQKRYGRSLGWEARWLTIRFGDNAHTTTRIHYLVCTSRQLVGLEDHFSGQESTLHRAERILEGAKDARLRSVEAW